MFNERIYEDFLAINLTCINTVYMERRKTKTIT